MKTKIKELRARYNLTQDDLGLKVWVTRATIWFLEKWTYNPSLKLAKNISIVLKESIDEIFIFEEDDIIL